LISVDVKSLQSNIDFFAVFCIIIVKYRSFIEQKGGKQNERQLIDCARIWMLS